MFPKSFKRLIDHFASLPSVGPKMAERLVLYLFKQDKEKLEDFSASLLELKNNLKYCRRCFNISEGDLCEICLDKNRDEKIICVVEEPLDVIAIERTRRFHGLYHVLGGTLIPSPDSPAKNLKLRELEKRVEDEKPQEIILATNATTEGEATALYVKKMLKDSGINPRAIDGSDLQTNINTPNGAGVKITRLARGLSSGSDLEYIDEITLVSAIENRK